MRRLHLLRRNIDSCDIGVTCDRQEMQNLPVTAPDIENSGRMIGRKKSGNEMRKVSLTGCEGLLHRAPGNTGLAA